MSLFLGPIHYWLYNKVKLQHDITEKIISLDSDLLRPVLGKIELKPLEEVIDTSNIHGWLQAKVSLCEERLAKAVTILINKDSDNLSLVEDIFYNKGKEITKDYPSLSAPEFYKLINDTLLDGMPCDRTYSILEEAPDKVVLQRNTCVHEKFWNSENAPIQVYYQLRNQFIKGMADEKDLFCRYDGNGIYIIERSL